MFALVRVYMHWGFAFPLFFFSLSRPTQHLRMSAHTASVQVQVSRVVKGQSKINLDADGRLGVSYRKVILMPGIQ